MVLANSYGFHFDFQFVLENWPRDFRYEKVDGQILFGCVFGCVSVLGCAFGDCVFGCAFGCAFGFALGCAFSCLVCSLAFRKLTFLIFDHRRLLKHSCRISCAWIPLPTPCVAADLAVDFPAFGVTGVWAIASHRVRCGGRLGRCLRRSDAKRY